MKRLLPCSAVVARFLTLTLCVALCSCALTQQYTLDRCKSRAYVRTVLGDYLSTRYHSSAPVRLAVVPFSTPANLAQRGPELPGIGNQLAWKVQAALVASELVPIVEVLNRQDWPRKKEEFSTGNFNAISTARDAGYDLVLVANVQPVSSLDALSIESKLIETESGITLWYGTTTVHSFQRASNRELSSIWLDTEQPAMLDTAALIDDSAACLVRELTNEEP